LVIALIDLTADMEVLNSLSWPLPRTAEQSQKYYVLEAKMKDSIFPSIKCAVMK